MKLKLLVLAFLLLLFFSMKGQAVINMAFYPSMDKISYITIIKLENNKIKIVFSQREITEESRQKLETISANITIDSLMILLRREEYISLSDSCIFTNKNDTLLFESLTELLSSNTKIETAETKNVVRLDGMTCSLEILNSDTRISIEYRPTQINKNDIVHEFITQVLKALSSKTENEKVNIYCRKILSAYM